MKFQTNKNDRPEKPSSSNLSIKTLNVRSIKGLVDLWEDNLIKHDDNIEKITIKDKPINRKRLKGLELINWIDQNKESIIILTETKLNSTKKAFTFKNKVNKLTNQAFWIFSNNINNSDQPSKGVITMIPKKFFLKPEHKIIEKGLVTQYLLTHKI